MPGNRTPLMGRLARRALAGSTARRSAALSLLGLVIVLGSVVGGVGFLVALGTATSAPAGDPASIEEQAADALARCPLIPNSSQIELSPEEWAQIDAGEIIIRIVRESDQISRAQAVGYLEAHPLWLFELATDSELAPEIVDEVRRVEVHELRSDGKLATGYIKAARLLPMFRYTFASRYLPSYTGQCWAQVDGDFSRNEGAHSFLWDPARQKSLSVFSFTIGMKGLLSLIPERLVLKGAADTLPSFMRSLDTMQVQVSQSDPERAQRIDEAWARTRPRLEAGEFPGRVWLGYAPPKDADLAQSVEPAGQPKEVR